MSGPREARRSFLNPRSVAVVGASERSGWTATLVRGWETSENPPRLHLVNPRGGRVHGRPAVRSVADLPEPVDLAFVLVGPGQVLGVVRECLAHGIRDFVLLSHVESSGGAQVEAELREMARRFDARILGPNVSGFVNLAAGIVLFGLPRPTYLRRGHVGFVMQSGGLSTHALSLAAQWNVGISTLVATGNEAGITLTDVVELMVDDPDTHVIALFIESVRDPEAFRAAARRARAAGKPIVALMVGSSELGRSSALAHTGALVGDFARARAAVERLGVATVASLEELVMTAGMLAHLPRPLSGSRVGVVAASGGACELIADAAHQLGLALPPFPEPVAAELAALIPGADRVLNPLDLTGVVVKDSSLSLEAIRLLAESAADAYDVLIFQSVVLPSAEDLEQAAIVQRFTGLSRIAADSPVPIVFQTAASYSLSPPVAEFLADLDLLVLPGIATGMRVVQALMRSEDLRARSHFDTWECVHSSPDLCGDVHDLARECGVAMPPTQLVATPAEGGDVADSLGYPVVVKVESPEIAHKTDVGGVVLDLETRGEVERAIQHMSAAVRQAAPHASISGYRVCAMREDGLELLVGVVNDDAWGWMLTVGAGGVLAELLEDTAVRPLPVTAAEVHEMLQSLRVARRFAGYRGSPAVSEDALVRGVLGVVELARRVGTRARAVEVNPLWVDGARVEALDLLVEWSAGP